ncbi:hypothetical protein HRbin15_02040 [bacterium HR15]|nr:hypothetical protein HRbin15_02040 [bacterium HR15]
MKNTREMTGQMVNNSDRHSKKHLYYTFGNHMHWVDMEWLWGYGVLPDSVRDMLRFCHETGAKGNINFDAVGYERLAVEAPDALAELREAIARGQVEVVGASYGQPYGLFHGGESNIRQRVYGVRTVMRLLSVRPRTFWEEEFDFFPQLPQILRGVGYEYACLFFQWTWHTPVMPVEEVPAIYWEGQDGSRLLAAPRHKLNLHQWPEDFAGLLESPLLREAWMPCIVQWLELMPSPDWMCRAELMLPPLRMLMQHPDFELRFVTLSEYLEQARDYAVPRRYTLDDVFHGMSLGKNGDLFRRLSRQAEQALLTAESLAAMMGLFGRPYAHWDVYPVWELEEAWRELLAAQHHDNDECEGLCGHIGRRSYERSLALSAHITDRSLHLLAARTQGEPGRIMVYNPLGWQRDAMITHPATGRHILMRNLPPLGYRVVSEADDLNPLPSVAVERDAHIVLLQRDALKVVVDRTRGVITQLFSREFPEGILRPDCPLGQLQMMVNGEPERFEEAEVEIEGDQIVILRRGKRGATVQIEVRLAPERDGVDLHYVARNLPRPDGGVKGALKTALAVNLPSYRLIHDHPYGISEIRAEGVYLRKYPTGDWMTSPQVFEEIHNPFTALQLLDFDGGERGLLYLHDGSQAFLREGEYIQNILTMYDPWDEHYFINEIDIRVRLVPHGIITHTERWRLAQEFTRPVLVASTDQPPGDLPPVFGSVWCDAPNVLITAFYRESERFAGANLEHYAGRGMEFPYVLRLVEFNGEAASVRLRLAGEVASAFRTNLLGEPMESLTVQESLPIEGISPCSQIELSLHPYEITTLYLDIVQGRKVPRNLDAYRHVWATVHRVQAD